MLSEEEDLRIDSVVRSEGAHPVYTALHLFKLAYNQ